MATSGNRGTRTKSNSPKRKSSSKRPAKTKRRKSKSVVAAVKGQARQGAAAAREGLEVVKDAGGRTWAAMKSATVGAVKTLKHKAGK